MKIKICPKCHTINDGCFNACKRCYMDIENVTCEECTPEEIERIKKMNVDELQKKAWLEKENRLKKEKVKNQAADGLRKEAYKVNKEKYEKNGGYYEYKAVSIKDSFWEKADVTEIQEQLSDLGRDGWKLVTSFTNEVGTKAAGVAIGSVGVGTNRTINETILIFERLVAFE